MLIAASDFDVANLAIAIVVPFLSVSAAQMLGERREHRNQVKDVLISVRKSTTELFANFKLRVGIRDELQQEGVSEERITRLRELHREAMDNVGKALLEVNYDYFAVVIVLGDTASAVVASLNRMVDVATTAIGTDSYTPESVVALGAAREQFNAEIIRLWSEVNRGWMNN